MMKQLSPKQELECIKEFHKKKSDLFYPVPLGWLNCWVNYTTGQGTHPGTISFAELLDKQGKLKKGLKVGTDFQILNKDQWLLLKRIYSSDFEHPARMNELKPETDSRKVLSEGKPPRPANLRRPVQIPEKKEPIRKTSAKLSNIENVIVPDPLYKTTQGDIQRSVTHNRHVSIKPIRSITPAHANKKATQRSSNTKTETQITTPTQEPSTRFLRTLAKSALKFGIINPRFQCFMNTVLQCLFSFPSFVQIFLALSHTGPVSRSLCAAIQEARESKKTDVIVSCQSLASIFSKGFPGYKQHDAPEFCRTLLDKLDEEFPKPAKSDKSPWDQCRSSFSPLISDHFLGMLCSTVKCCTCKNESFSYEPFTMLMLELNHNIESSISDFLSKEIISNYRCERCQKTTKIFKNFDFHKLPKNLIVQLKRFKCEIFPQKLDNKCDFGLTLDMIDQNGDVFKYELVAVGVHLGSVLGGHYFAYGLRDQWFRFDDENVTEVDIKKVISAQAYLLCYRMLE